MFFIVKVVVSGLVIAFCSGLAGKKPQLAGFITALPLTSMLAILWAYLQKPEMEGINRYAVSVLAAVPLSLFFFVPFVLNRWVKLPFGPSFLLGLGLLYLAYRVHSLWLGK